MWSHPTAGLAKRDLVLAAGPDETTNRLRRIADLSRDQHRLQNGSELEQQRLRLGHLLCIRHVRQEGTGGHLWRYR